jgi:hypothetical protein
MRTRPTVLSVSPPISSVIWRPIANDVGTVSGYHVVTNKATLPRLFFRLRRE